jgi:hypothetical protein
MESDMRTIRTDVRTERAKVHELDLSLTSEYLKARLGEASDLLEDVEGWLAAPTERGAAADSARWLDFVDSILEMAVQRRQCIQNLVKRFGPNIETGYPLSGNVERKGQGFLIHPDKMPRDP